MQNWRTKKLAYSSGFPRRATLREAVAASVVQIAETLPAALTFERREAWRVRASCRLVALVFDVNRVVAKDELSAA